jgi:hypothetical protein
MTLHHQLKNCCSGQRPAVNGAITSLSLRGHVLVDVAAALS